MAAIAYYPSQQHASVFNDKQHSTEKLEHEAKVPDGFPGKLQSPLAWTRDEIENKRNAWIVELGVKDIEALEQALSGFEGKHWSLLALISAVGILKFSRSSVGRLISSVRRDIHPPHRTRTSVEKHLKRGL
ncbi:MAG: hypothetical protein CL912_08585 [Deltaproteobacteria bacterium]|mgnify:CR=1 FL=1|nr:hypothetical protein [Deltaproteobacteria bacterium]